jgi:hypothetical protein
MFILPPLACWITKRTTEEKLRIMANWDNQSTKIIQDEQRAAYDEGLVEGYEANPNVLPAFWFRKPLINLTNRERAYMVGREIKLQELAERGRK